MLHRRYVLADLHIGDRRVTLRHGDVVIAARAETGALDWEVLAHTVEPVEVARQVHDLTLSCIVGADDDGALLHRDDDRPGVPRACRRAALSCSGATARSTAIDLTALL